MDAGRGIALLGLVTGLVILFKALTQKTVEYYRCGVCNRIILKKSYARCPYCRTAIDWVS